MIYKKAGKQELATAHGNGGDADESGGLREISVQRGLDRRQQRNKPTDAQGETQVGVS